MTFYATLPSVHLPYRPANLQVTTAMKQRLTNGSKTTGETDDWRRGSGGGYGGVFTVGVLKEDN